MKKNKLLVFAISIAVLVGIAGCAPKDTGLNNTNNRLSTQTRIGQNTNRDLNRNLNVSDNLNNNIGDYDSLNRTYDYGGNLNNGMSRDTRFNTMTTSLGNLNNTANDLARKIGALPEVNKASVVLTNDTCLVGLDLRGTNNGTNNVTNTNTNNNNISTALRQKIESIVRDTANVNADDISITADPDLTTRIQGISTNMTNTVGNDINTFTNDIEDIIRRIIPGTRTNTNTINR
jgi:YhcN/YlaJ family sporulation lipoprotein